MPFMMTVSHARREATEVFVLHVSSIPTIPCKHQRSTSFFVFCALPWLMQARALQELRMSGPVAVALIVLN